MSQDELRVFVPEKYITGSDVVLAPYGEHGLGWVIFNSALPQAIRAGKVSPRIITERELTFVEETE